jgi:hypothetical protein
VSAFSNVFGRKALKIKRVWDFTKVYRHKCRRQCVDFCLKKCAKTHLHASVTLKIFPGAQPPGPQREGIHPSRTLPLNPHLETSGFATDSGSDVRQNGKRKVQKRLLMRSCTDQHEARICTVTSTCAYLTVYGLNLCRFLDEEAASFDFV